MEGDGRFLSALLHAEALSGGRPWGGTIDWTRRQRQPAYSCRILPASREESTWHNERRHGRERSATLGSFGGLVAVGRLRRRSGRVAPEGVHDQRRTSTKSSAQNYT